MMTFYAAAGSYQIRSEDGKNKYNEAVHELENELYEAG